MQTGSHTSSNNGFGRATQGLTAQDTAPLRAKIAKFNAEVEATAARGLAAIRGRGRTVPFGCRYSKMDRRPHVAPQRMDGMPVLAGPPAQYKPALGGGERPFPGGRGPGVSSGADSAMARAMRATRGLC